MSHTLDLDALTEQVLAYWFGPLDDTTPLDRDQEPFATFQARWYGKDPVVDAHIADQFEPALHAVAASWGQLRSAIRRPDTSLAITVLLDQFPRNMYRDTPQMYAYDGLATAHATASLSIVEPLPLVQRTFAYMPLMHAEDASLQRVMEAEFARLVEQSATRCPHSTGYFESALGYATRHREIVERFGRFPHRNAILRRTSTEEERRALRDEDLAF